MDPNLQKYVQESLRAGIKPEEVKQALLGVGWQANDIDKAMSDFYNNESTDQTTASKQSYKKTIIVLSVLFIIVLSGWGVYAMLIAKKETATTQPKLLQEQVIVQQTLEAPEEIIISEVPEDTQPIAIPDSTVVQHTTTPEQNIESDPIAKTTQDNTVLPPPVSAVSEASGIKACWDKASENISVIPGMVGTTLLRVNSSVFPPESIGLAFSPNLDFLNPSYQGARYFNPQDSYRSILSKPLSDDGPIQITFFLEVDPEVSEQNISGSITLKNARTDIPNCETVLPVHIEIKFPQKGDTLYSPQPIQKRIIQDRESGMNYAFGELTFVFGFDLTEDEAWNFIRDLGGKIVGGVSDVGIYQVLFIGKSQQEVDDIAKEVQAKNPNFSAGRNWMNAVGPTSL